MKRVARTDDKSEGRWSPRRRHHARRSCSGFGVSSPARRGRAVRPDSRSSAPGLLRVQCKWAVLDGDVVAVRCYDVPSWAGRVHPSRLQAREIDVDRGVLPGARRLLSASARDVRSGEASRAAFALAPSRNNQQRRSIWAERLRVRQLHLPGSRAHSSAGRASSWQPEGRRFEPDWVHRSGSLRLGDSPSSRSSSRSCSKRSGPSFAPHSLSISVTAARIVRPSDTPRGVSAIRLERAASGSGWRTR